MLRSPLLAISLSTLPLASVLAQDDPRLAPVTAQVGAMVERHGLPGAVLLISQDGRLVYARAFGSYTLDTRIPIASASKWLSATVLARLVDQGRLDWDDRLGDYADDVPADKAALTLRQLLSLTSGLPGGKGSDGDACLNDRATTLEACARKILSLPLNAAPGTSFDYGGNSMQVAGWMAERATGQDWNRLFREQLAAPLALQGTDYGLFPGVDVGNPRIAGGVHSTAPDYLKLVQLHLEGGRHAGQRLLDPDTVAEGQRNQTTGTTLVYTPYPQSAGYGLGQWIDAEDTQGHTRGVSSPGAFSFTPWLDNRLGLAAVFATFGSYARQANDLRALQASVALALTKDTSAVPFADFGGIWWNPAESGAGYFLVQRADHTLVLAWYTYEDADGAQQWLLGTDGRWIGADTWAGTLYRTRHDASGAISHGVTSSAIVSAVAGRMQLRFLDGGRAELDFTLDGITRRIDIKRFPF